MFFFDDSEPSHSKDELALFTASAQGDHVRVEELMNQGIHPHVKINGFNALHTASMKNHSLVITKIVHAYPEMNTSQTDDGRTPLMIAAYQGHLEACRILEASSSSMHMVDKQVWRSVITSSDSILNIYSPS